MLKLGFIGVGHLGAHLAGSLLRAGFPLTVYDLKREAAAGLLEAGAQWADSPKAVAETADSVFTCLPSPAAVTAVVGGPDGVLAGLRAGGTWIDMSTNDRHEIERLAALAAEQGAACLEAPVTGGVHKAAAGEITVLVGGDRAVFEAHLPALEAMEMCIRDRSDPMSLATKNGANPAGVMIRLMLHDDEVFRLPPASRGVQVVSGLAWLTVAGEDIFLKNDQRLWLVTPGKSVLVSALGQTPLVLEVLGDSTSASPTMESMVKNLTPTQGCVC